MEILALDPCKINSAARLFDSETRKSFFLTTSTQRGHMESLFKNHPANLIVMQAWGLPGGSTTWLKKLGFKALVCSTNEEAWRWGQC